MAKQIFISHAESDLDLIDRILSPIQNLPFDLIISVAEPEPGRIHTNITNQISNADVFIPVLTQDSKDNQWVNQEIGYAINQNATIIPLFEDDSMLGGLISDINGVELDRYNNERTTFEVISMLRQDSQPLSIGPLMPNWYLELKCNYGNCKRMNYFTIDRAQNELWEMHKNGNNIWWECENCGSQYHYNPATFEFVKRTKPS